MKKSVLATMLSLTLVLVLSLTLCLGQVVLADDSSSSDSESNTTSVQLPDGTVGTPYSYQFPTQEGAAWMVGIPQAAQKTAASPRDLRVQKLSAMAVTNVATTVGSLPPGLSLSNTGLLSGTPTQAGTWRFMVSRTSGGTTYTYNCTLIILPGQDKDTNQLYYYWEPSGNAPALGEESSEAAPQDDANPNTGAY